MIEYKKYFFCVVSTLLVLPIFININGIYNDVKIISDESSIFLKPIPINFYIVLTLSFFLIYRNRFDLVTKKYLLFVLIFTLIFCSNILFFGFSLSRTIYFFQCLLPTLGIIFGYFFFTKKNIGCSFLYRK